MSDLKHEIIPAAETLPARAVLHPAVAEVLRQNPTPETLRELLALQREWEAGEARRAYTRALVALKADLPPWIGRDKKVDFASSKGRVHYTHTSLAGMMDAVQGPLTLHGFSLSWTPATDPTGKVSVTARLTHRDGHHEDATLSSPPDSAGLKSAAQAIASTITLLQRYTALSLLGLATADMDEQHQPTAPAAAANGGMVDSARNMKAMRAIIQEGKTKAAAEALVGRTVQEWTSTDLDKLRAWIMPPTPEQEQIIDAQAPEEEAPPPPTMPPPLSDAESASVFDDPSKLPLLVTILDVLEKKGVKNGKPWTRYGVKISDGRAEILLNTFSSTLAATAVSLLTKSALVTYSTKKHEGRDVYDLLSIEPQVAHE